MVGETDGYWAKQDLDEGTATILSEGITESNKRSSSFGKFNHSRLIPTFY
jgi:hypothetical protein